MFHYHKDTTPCQFAVILIRTLTTDELQLQQIHRIRRHHIHRQHCYHCCCPPHHHHHYFQHLYRFHCHQCARIVNASSKDLASRYRRTKITDKSSPSTTVRRIFHKITPNNGIYIVSKMADTVYLVVLCRLHKSLRAQPANGHYFTSVVGFCSGLHSLARYWSLLFRQDRLQAPLNHSRNVVSLQINPLAQPLKNY